MGSMKGILGCCLMSCLMIWIYGCSGPTPIQGSGTLKTFSQTLPPFYEIEIRGEIQASFEEDPHLTDRIVVSKSGDDNLLDYIRIWITDTRLNIETQIPSDHVLEPKLGLIVEGKIQSIQRIVLQKQARLMLSKLRDREVYIHLEDQSQIEIRDAKHRLTFETQGESLAKIQGQLDNLLILASDNSKIDAYRVTLKKAQIIAKDQSTVVLCAKDLLEVTLSGSAVIIYYCKPDLLKVHKDPDWNGRLRYLPTFKYEDIPWNKKNNL